MNIRDLWMQRQLQNQQPQPPNPALVAAQQPQPSNPIGEGVSSAISAARQSLMAKEPEPGIMQDVLGRVIKAGTNLGISRLRTSHLPHLQAFGGMMQTPDEQENLRIKQNMEIMKHLAHQKALEEQQAARQRQFDEEMRYKREVLNETRRYHQATEGNAKGRNGAEKPMDEINGIDLRQYPAITTKQKENYLFKKVADSQEALRFVNDIKSDFDTLKKISEGNFISPTGSDIPFAYKTKALLSRHGVTGWKQEVLLRDSLSSKFSQIEPILEKRLKGSAAGEQLIKRFHKDKVYFSIDQPPDILEARLKEALDLLETDIKHNSLSLATKRLLPENLVTKRLLPEDEEAEIPEVIAKKPVNASSVNSIFELLKSQDPNLSDEDILEAMELENNAE